MCRPTYYTIAYEINPWMSLTRQVAQRTALRQWQALYTLLTKRLKVSVRLLEPVEGLPDLIFTANAGLVVGRLPATPSLGSSLGVAQAGTFIRSNFRHPQRQGEEPIVERYFKRKGLRIVRLPRSFNFEGEGDALFVGETLFFGFRFRSDATAHASLARALQCRVLPLELVDKRFYHLDTCFCPLNETSIVWYPKAFDRYGRKVIETHVNDLVAVSQSDALRFCCNAIVVNPAPVSRAAGSAQANSLTSSDWYRQRHPLRQRGGVNRTIVLHRGVSGALRRQLARRGFELAELDLSEFLKAGGSAKCLVLHLAAHGA